MKQQKTLLELQQESYLSGGNDAYLESLYDTFLKNPEELDPEWQDYFKSISNNSHDVSHADIRDYFANLAKNKTYNVASPNGAVDLEYQYKQEKVINLINAYQSFGHLKADIDPLGLYKGVDNPTLNLKYYGFTEADLNLKFDVGSYIGLNTSEATLGEIHKSLQKVYCGSIGVQYMHITEFEEVEWIQKRMEQGWNSFKPSKEEQLRILDRLVVADGLEKYLGSKYVGQKRFSLEGGDSLMPMLDAMVERGAENGLKDLIIGMAHRGRLNVLINLLGKAPKEIFANFEDQNIDEASSGDVKYHLGYSSNLKTSYGPVHVALAFNPSHLEIVSPVVQGSVRARQRRRKDTNRKYVMPIQIHGDAAFAGQGVVMETFSMSQARWFWVGGSVHIVINNQIGFTTSNPQDARSSVYCTDVAKMLEAPILHVNANDPEAVYFVAKLAMDFHERFKKDIVIDLVCYRRHGHNEADEPSATQPLMYKAIKKLPTTPKMYAESLIKAGIIDSNKEKEIAADYRNKLDKGEPVASLWEGAESYEYTNAWASFDSIDWKQDIDTGVPLDKLTRIARQLEKIPEGFKVQPQVRKMLESRIKMTDGDIPLNWGYAEALAYGTLLDEGFPIRLCGQDAGRGTFSHRHAVLKDQNNGEVYIPLSNIKEDQVHINIVNSLLSEEAVLAFEYGFASTVPNDLVLWEAQFGDFANGAQVVIDQFISSGEQKWGRLCGLVMLLPHGQEGIGPEHSSARLERYLQLCAQDNMQVCNPTTPAQFFHLLRRQMLRKYRKPLIVMTPKSPLRNPLAVSTLNDLVEGEFQTVIPETSSYVDANKVDRVILCNGKVFYDLLEKRNTLKLENVAIIRIEQLYPFPADRFKEVMAPFNKLKNIIWCQEEPINQGAWYSIQHFLYENLPSGQAIEYIGRSSMAAPSGGYTSVHVREQNKIILEALTGKN